MINRAWQPVLVALVAFLLIACAGTTGGDDLPDENLALCDPGAIAAVEGGERMDVVVVLTRDAAAEVRSGSARSEAGQALARLVDEMGLTLRPQHPTVSAEELARFYLVDAPADRVEEVVACLLPLDAVEGAYAKPGDEPAG